MDCKVAKLDPSTGKIVTQSAWLTIGGRGITLGAGSIWVGELNNKIQKINPSTLTTVGSFAAPGTETCGLAFDGTYLWIIEEYQYKVHKVTTSGTGVGSVPVPKGYRTGLAWESSGLWTNTAPYVISHYNPSGTVTATVTLTGLPAGDQIYDIAIGGGKLYVTTLKSDTIYVYKWP